MLKEFLINDKCPKKEKITKAYWTLFQNKLDTLCLPVGLLSYYRDFSPEFLSAQIDFPFGLSTLKSKTRDIIYASGYGTKNIDVVFNHFNLENYNEKELLIELEVFKKSAKKDNIRVIFDYRMFNGNQIDKFGELCVKSLIDTIILGTGTMTDDPVDSIVIAKRLEKKFNINCICSNIVRSEKVLNYIINSEIYGIRTSTLSNLDLILGV